MFNAARAAIQEGNSQNKMMSKAKRVGSEGVSADLVRALTLALKDGRPGAKQHPKGGKRHEDEALAAFRHNANPAQEAAAAAAQKAPPNKAKLKEKLESMPPDGEIRKSILHEVVCKFFWEPNLTCTRQACRFLHVTPEETRKLGIEDSEVKAAVHAKGH